MNEMDAFSQRLLDLHIDSDWRAAGDPHNLAQLDVALNKFSSCARQIELELDALERSKLAESESAEQLWLEQLRLLQEQIELQREAYEVLHSRCEDALIALEELGEQEQLSHVSAKAEDVHFRWNTLRLRALGLQVYAQDSHEHARQLLFSIRELLTCVLNMRTQLMQRRPLPAELGALSRMRNEQRVFASRLEEKRPLVESTLMAGRHYLAQQPLLAAAHEDYVEDELCGSIRRYITKLTDKWTELCQIANNRETMLEDVQLKLIHFQKLMEDVGLKLHIAEVNKSTFLPISEISSEKISFYLNELKAFRDRVIPLQESVEQVNKLSNVIAELNVHLSSITLNSLEELNTRWRLLQLSIEERQKALERGIGSCPTGSGLEQQQQQMLSTAVEQPWERAVVSCNQVPYYINHAMESTHWDHPKMMELMNSLNEFNEIRYSAYRFALKLRVVQRRLALDLVPIHNLNAVFDSHNLRNDQQIAVPQMIACLHSIYNSCANSLFINIPLSIDLCLNWMLNLYDTVTRMGSIRVTAFKMGLITLCKATIDEKYLFMFQLICNSNGLADESKLAHLIHCLIQIPRYLNELIAFGGSNVDFSVRSCLEMANKYEIEFRDFLNWVQREPQSLVWLAVLHRIIHSEQAKHMNVKCCVCKQTPIIGLRYRCLRCFNTDFCQNCFFYGRYLKGHKLTHPMQEYCYTSTSGENVRDLTRILCNKFKSKNYFLRKNVNTGFMPLHGMLMGDEILINGSYDASFLDANQTLQSQMQQQKIQQQQLQQIHQQQQQLQQQQILESQANLANVNGLRATQRAPIDATTHTEAIYQNLNGNGELNLINPLTSPMHQSAQMMYNADMDQRAELEAIIGQLEDENRDLKLEYERLKQERINTNKQQALLEEANFVHHQRGRKLDNEPFAQQAFLRREEMLGDAQQLKQQSERLDAQMEVLESHNKQLLDQMARLRQMLNAEQSFNYGNAYSVASIENRLASYHSITKGEMFIVKALEKILADREICKSHNASIKKCCEQTLEEIKMEMKQLEEKSQGTTSTVISNGADGDSTSGSSALPLPKQASQTVDAEKYFQPFALSCKSKSNRIVIVAIDCIQKLIAYGHITGAREDANAPGKRLIDTIVDTICVCYVYDETSGYTPTDEGIQLQVIKALLTLVTSEYCEVQEKSLLKAVRTCYNIFLGSRNSINRSTAKATLQQMLNMIFTRMELSNLAEDDSSFSLKSSRTENPLENPDIHPEIRTLMAEMLQKVCTELGEPNLQKQRNDSLQEENTLRSYQSNKSLSDIGDPDSLDACTEQLRYAKTQQRDAYLVFRWLCKLSQQALPETNVDPKSNKLRSKMLSLQLILSILQNSGPTFQQSDLFAIAIKQYLCVSLSKNGVSTVLEVFELSLNIFVSLLQNFKAHLKMQIEVFIKDIFLNILETPTSTFEQKWLVIQALTKICADAQSVVEIYINYDCDIRSANIFERLVNDLSKIAQGRCQLLEVGHQNVIQQRSIRIRGLECLVSLLQCMVEWSKDLYQNPSQMTKKTLNGLEGQEEIARSTSSNSLNSLGKSSTASFSTRENGDNLNMLEVLEVKKQQKDLYEEGLEKFRNNAKKGVAFLQQHGYVGISAQEIAQFFHSEDRLDKTMMGDYLGDHSPFNVSVMCAYVDMLDFSNKDIVPALRLFLEGFRLPGEAQKIDRLMEKFAARFFQMSGHESYFTSADTVYVLAYSIIMLTTDLHNPHVKQKTSKQDYIQRNRGINDMKDLPAEYLSQVYDEIAGEEIKMKPGGSSTGLKNMKTAVSEKQRKLLHYMEMEQMAATARALMESVAHVETQFTSAKHLEHVKPMFKIAWRPFLAAFSIGLQDCDDQDIATLCLEGMRFSIRIACIFRMDTEREAYVQALSRFTLLTARSNRITEMKSKNIDTIKTLISIASTDGNYLGKSWLDVLRCVSQLELAQLIGTTLKPSSLQSKFESFGLFAMDSLTRATRDTKKDDQPINQTTSQSVVVAVDRIFTGSEKLDGDAIVDFVNALCQVSSEELSHPTHPRMFSLQKIVEISYYNMSRIRLQWSRIWSILGEHFNKVGCSANEEIAFFAIDSLRQLSMKFIEKGEFANFRFQKDFLRPFEYIMKNNKSTEIRDIVVGCITQMVKLQAKNIRSGWKNIFSVFLMAASETEERIVDTAFQTTSYVINYHYPDYFSYMVDSFQDTVKCLAEFASNQRFPDTSSEAVTLIKRCARYISTKPHMFKELSILELKQENQNGRRDFSEEDRIWIRGWFPILFVLSCIMNVSKLEVRTQALTVMFEIIKLNGSTFKPDWWKDLSQIISRIFHSMKMGEQQKERIEWMTTTCNQAIFQLMDVFIMNFDQLQPILMDTMLNHLIWCCEQEHETLSVSGTSCLENVVICCGSRFTPQNWDLTGATIERVFINTLPQELLTWKPDDSKTETKHIFAALKIRAIVQVELIKAVDNIIFYPVNNAKRQNEITTLLESELNDRQARISGRKKISIAESSTLDLKEQVSSENDTTETSNQCQGLYPYMSNKLLLKLIDCLLQSHRFACEFNCNKHQKNVLWKAGFHRNATPNLLNQESQSIYCALRILFRMCNDEKRKEEEAQVKDKLITLCGNSLQYYLALEAEMHRDAWASVIILIFTELCELSDSQFREHLCAYFPLICDLLYNDLKPFLRTVLRRVFLRIGIVFIPQNASLLFSNHEKQIQSIFS